MRINIRTSKGEIKGSLNDSESAKRIYGLLPIKGNANLWGEEIYFEIPLQLNLEDGFEKQRMEIGEIAYWPAGNAFCVFFGKTPASKDDKPVAASDVNLLGNVEDSGIEKLKEVEDGEEIVVEKDG